MTPMDEPIEGRHCPTCGDREDNCECWRELLEIARREALDAAQNLCHATRTMKVYLKIGLYQSVAPVPLDEISATLRFPGAVLRFEFRDSGERADDGVPIWTAEDVAVSYDARGTADA